MALFLNINKELLINIEKVISIIPNYEYMEITFTLQENGDDDHIVFRHADFHILKEKSLEEKENTLKKAMEKIEDAIIDAHKENKIIKKIEIEELVSEYNEVF